MELDVAYNSFIGMRENQEDALSCECDGRNCIAVLCDGVGGLDMGERASAAAVETFRALFTLDNLAGADIPTLRRRALHEMDERVSALAGETANAHLGTTVVAAVIRNDQLFWISVGDSRLYILRDGELLQATRDHNYSMTLDFMRKNEMISSETMSREQKRGDALVSYIGIGGLELFDICEFPFILKDGDVILLSTDGLYKTMSEDRIKSVLMQCSVMQFAANQLTEFVKNNMTEDQDNTSFIIIQVNGSGDDKQ